MTNFSRRRAVAASALGLVPLAGPLRAYAASAGPGARLSGRVRLHPAGSVVRSASLPIPGAPLARSAASGAAVVRHFETDTFAMAGFTWRGVDPGIEVRARRSSWWTPWTALEPTHDLPDRETVEGVSARRASVLWWAGASDAVEVRIVGSGYRDLQLVLLDPGELASDHRLPAITGRARGRRRAPEDPAAVTRVPKPPIYKRPDWGADERLRDSTPSYTSELRQVHIHHTVNANDYRRQDVPALLRGAYSYHTRSLGWSDIGYNFLVDRFGRAWMGRAGGMGKRVRGAHTLGFNEASTGIAAIGNFETAVPTAAMTRTIAHLAAWKLDKAGRRPTGKVKVTSTGSDLYRSGTQVRLPVIDGHRDTNQTACPGKNLYAQLPAIRKLAQQLVDQYPEPS